MSTGQFIVSVRKSTLECGRNSQLKYEASLFSSLTEVHAK